MGRGWFTFVSTHPFMLSFLFFFHFSFSLFIFLSLSFPSPSPFPLSTFSLLFDFSSCSTFSFSSILYFVQISFIFLSFPSFPAPTHSFFTSSPSLVVPFTTAISYRYYHSNNLTQTYNFPIPLMNILFRSNHSNVSVCY